jgi:hypothetical protein
MDVARDARTYELVEAEELWSMAQVDKDSYICRGCTTQVFPASYNKEQNKKRPYFSLGPVNKHKSGCDVDGEEKVVKRATKERIGTPSGFPLPFPNKLTLTDERPTQTDGAKSPTMPRDTSASGRSGSDDFTPKKHHGHTVKTIRPACRVFINFPNDREFLPLEVPGVSGNSYAKIFQNLGGGKKPHFFSTPKRLYYAPIRWTAEPTITETSCTLTLNAGEWDTVAKRYKSLCQVRVNWSDWSQSRRDALLREFNTTRAEAIEEAKKDTQIKGWLFLVGTQDDSDPSIFHVDNCRFICSLSANLVLPKK